jgi:hypothetical protein
VFYIGIDNGLHGAVACIDNNKKVLMVQDFTDKDLLHINIKLSILMFDSLNINKQACVAVLEKPIMGGNRDGYALGSMFRVYGIWEALLRINGINFTDANPAIRHKTCWRKEFNFKSIMSADLKQESIKKCLELFPDSESLIKRDRVIKGKNGRKQLLTDVYNDNKAEAVLLAEYCRRINNKE